MTNIQPPLSYKSTPVSAGWWEIRNPSRSRGLWHLPELYFNKGQVPCVQHFLWKYFWSCRTLIQGYPHSPAEGWWAAEVLSEHTPVTFSQPSCVPTGTSSTNTDRQARHPGWQNKWECATLVQQLPTGCHRKHFASVSGEMQWHEQAEGQGTQLLHEPSLMLKAPSW